MLQVLLVVAVVQQPIEATCPVLGCPVDLFAAEDGDLVGRSTTMAGKLLACDFEYTQKQATSLGLKGWCMNTRDGTVKGQMEGEAKPINEMKYWLQNKGSPTSRIDKAVFGELKEIPKYSYNDFGIKR
ncbi:acylphosphatase [Culex quinquefasciatus]|uniref:acylphosphatase n=1 Tax=Culex quinquefasciatus TaxID=7176 RepID=B0WYQ1_CULQU|nr:acylphosphatase [Culex quinquefasciatus]|eukprot:XP_001862523.1 acylphosphatase [Culex quinquefasciatus]